MNSWFTPTVLFVVLNVMIGTIFFTSTSANEKHHQKPQNDDAQPPNRLARSPSVLQRLKSFNLNNYRSQEPHFNPDSDSHFTSEQKTNSQNFYQQIPDSDTHFASQQETTHNFPDHDTHFAPEQKIQETHNFFQQTPFDPTSDSDTHYAQNHTHENETHFNEEESLSIDEVYSQLKERQVNRTNSDTKPSGGEMPERLPGKMRKSASAKSAFGHFEENDVVEARRPATVREGNSRLTEEDDEGVDSKADDFINKFKQQLKLQRLDSIIRYKDTISKGGGKWKVVWFPGVVL